MAYERLTIRRLKRDGFSILTEKERKEIIRMEKPSLNDLYFRLQEIENQIEDGTLVRYCDRCKKAKAVEFNNIHNTAYCKRCYRAITDSKSPY